MRLIRSALSVVSVCGVLGCGQGGLGAPPQGDPPENLSELETAFVDAHNAARASATPTPDPALPPLAWSTSLAATAQAWAQGCVFEHSDNSLGENLALFSPREITPQTAADVVALWDGERVDYTYDNNSCRAGAQCGHYTQLVWRDSTEVGCGVAECEDVPGFGAGSLWVCNYNPPGNFVGQRPY
jgi:pathogenesis-related protein 1